MHLILLALILCFTSLQPAQANDLNTLLDIPPGQSLVNLSASERVEVDQDLLTASLRYEAKNKNPRALQDDINTLMAKAVAAAKEVDSVKVSTGSYHIYEHNPHGHKGRHDIEWRGSQGLMIKGKKADELLELTGALQDMGLSMNGLSYSVSPELMEETQNDMLEDALEKLTIKAKRIAKALSKSEAELLQINVDVGGGVHHPQRMMARMDFAVEAAAQSMAAPVAAPGTQNITLTVSAQALIK